MIFNCCFMSLDCYSWKELMNTWFNETPQFVAKIHKSIGYNKYNEYFLHRFNENVIVATEWHGHVSGYPWSSDAKKQQTKYHSNGMARINTALLLKGVNNKFNKLHKSTQQDNERKRSTNGTNLTTSTHRISVLNSFHLVNAGFHWFQQSDLFFLFNSLLK